MFNFMKNAYNYIKERKREREWEERGGLMKCKQQNILLFSLFAFFQLDQTKVQAKAARRERAAEQQTAAERQAAAERSRESARRK